MAIQQTEFLKFTDKIYLTSLHYQGTLAAHYTGCQCAPVVERQKADGTSVRNFERCVFQIHQVRSAEQTGLLWGEAAESAKYVMYGQVVKIMNVFSERFVTIEKGVTKEDPSAATDAEADSRMKASLRAGVTQAPPPGHPQESLHQQQLFRILPKYKIREVGERVRLEDQIVIESVFSQLFVHATSVTTGLSVNWKSHQEEVMAAKGVVPAAQHLVDFQHREQKGAAWQMHAYETDKDRGKAPTEHCVTAGSAVILYHRDAEGFLLCDWQVQDAEHIFLDQHKIQKATYSVQDLPYCSNALWILEAEDSKRGGPVMFQRHKRLYRLKHMATGLYLTLNCFNSHDGNRIRDVTTTYRPEDKNTLLAIVPLEATDSIDVLTQNSFARLMFHYEEVWLHATNEFTVDEPVPCVVSQEDRFKAASLGTTGKLQRVDTTTKGYYEDVFAIRLVNPEEKESLTQVCNMVVTLQRFQQYWKTVKEERDAEKRAAQEQRQLHLHNTVRVKDKDGSPESKASPGSRRMSIKRSRDGKENGQLVTSGDNIMDELKKFAKTQETSKLIMGTVEALGSLALFCTMRHVTEAADPLSDQNGQSIRRHQATLFQQNVHNLVFKILKAPLEFGGLTLEAILHHPQYKNLKTIYTLGYRLIKLMVKDYKDMAELMVQFLPFVESQLGEMTMVADAYMQIISDNTRLLHQLHRKPLQLESFLWLIPEFGRKATYMTLMSACCTCEGSGMANNQEILSKKLQKMGRIGLLHPLRLVKGAVVVRPQVAFPSNIEKKIRRFKRRKESGEDGSSDDSSGSESESEEEERRVMSPYATRYAPRSRSMSPQAALLNVAYNIPGALKGCWVHTCDYPCVVPRWTRCWLQAQGGCISLHSTPDDVHPRTIPIYMFQRARADGVSGKQPPQRYAKYGLTLLYKAPQEVYGVDHDKRPEKKLLVCAENMLDRSELLVGLKREIKHSATVENADIELPDVLSSATASLTHMRAQMKALLKRNTQQEMPEVVGGEDGEGGGWIPIEEWVAQTDTENVRYFEQSIRFLAQLCVGANPRAVSYVANRCPPEVIMAGMVLQFSHPLCDPIRSGFFRLARHLFIENKRETIPKDMMMRFKDIVYDFISRNSRQEASEMAKNALMTEVLTMALGMITAGWYTNEELEHLFHPILKLLDGTSDSVDPEAKASAAHALALESQPVAQAPGLVPLPPQLDMGGEVLGGIGTDPAVKKSPGRAPASKAAREKASRMVRFKWTEAVQVVLESKLVCCKILRYLFNHSLTPEGASVDLKKWVQNVASYDKRLGNHPEGAFLDLKTDLLTQVLLDTSMYNGYPPLFREAVTLVLLNLAGPDSGESPEDDERAIENLAELLRGDLLGGNIHLTVNLWRHFKESSDDMLTIGLLRVLCSMIELKPAKSEIEKMQNRLNDIGVTPIVTQMIESKNEHVVSEALLVGQALLQFGNHNVQRTILRYFLSLNDEAFFMCTKDRLQKACMLIKTHESAMAQGDTLSGSGCSLNGDSNAKYKDCNMYQLEQLLRFLQLFCEGHNRELQDYLRDQSDNVHTYNLVKETITCLKHLLMIANCDEFVYNHIMQAFNTLTEYCQGPCPANQQALVNANITYEVNVVLSRPFPLLSEEARDELKNTALTNLLSVVEGVEDPSTPTIMTRTLDLRLMRELFNSVWKRRKEPEALDLGFTAFMLCKTLETFDEQLSDFIQSCNGFAFYTAMTGRIEICRDGSLVRVYFRIPFICSNLSDKTKEELLWNVNRETPTARIADFYDRAEELIYEIEFYERNFKEVCQPHPDALIRHAAEWFRQCKYYINSTIHYWENGMIFFAFLINAIICMNYVTDASSGTVVRKPFEGIHIESLMVRTVLTGLIAVQLVITVFLLFDFCVAKAPLIAHKVMKKERAEQKKRMRKKFSMKRYIEMFETDHADLEQKARQEASSGMDTSGNLPQVPGSPPATPRSSDFPLIDYDELSADEKLQLLNFDATWRQIIPAVSGDTHFIFLIASVAFSILGLTASPFWISLHLVAIINRSVLLQNVIKAVTKNGRSLVLTLLLGIIIIYLFTVLGFIIFRDAFKNENPVCEDGSDDCEDYHCDELFRCFVYAVTSGIRQGGGIGDLMSPPQWSSPYNGLRTAFDFAFFVVVIVILLNIIFGVIIDTFAELRSEKQKIEEDIRSYCFVCGIESSQFDRKAAGFEHHIKFDHNMWNYIFFIHHLQKKKTDEFNGQESYVHSMMTKGDLSFFPLNKAVCLEGKQEEDDQLVELTAIHSDTQKRVEKVETQVSAFQEMFGKESQDMKEYLEGVSKKVVEATAKRHAILGELYAALKTDDAPADANIKLRGVPVGVGSGG